MRFVITDERIPKECAASLSERGFTVIPLPPHASIPSPVASQTDMLVFRDGKTLIVPRDYLECNPQIREKLRSFKGYTLIESEETCGDKYPADAKFNAAVIGKRLLSKRDTVAKDILSHAEERDLELIHTKQGYPACTVLALDSEHAITADGGIARLLSEAGVNVLRIRDSEAIKLPPYRFGFIGGSAGVFEKTVYFVGNAASHPDYDNILAFINGIGFEAVSLAPTLDFILDVGGLAFIDDGAD